MTHRLDYAYNISIGATSTTGRAAPVGVRAVRIAAQAEAYLTIGRSPVATSTGSTLVRPTTQGEVFMIHEGDQVAVISSAGSTGFVNVTELTE